jgi:hypothetical protein
MDLPMDCPICGRRRLELIGGMIVRCEKCTTSSECDGFCLERYAEVADEIRARATAAAAEVHVAPMLNTQGARMLTAETITDAQIRELRASVLYNCTPFESKTDEETELLDLCEVALYALHEALGSQKYKARARCAKILNARNGH